MDGFFHDLGMTIFYGLVLWGIVRTICYFGKEVETKEDAAERIRRQEEEINRYS
jgi:hypothetical protein